MAINRVGYGTWMGGTIGGICRGNPFLWFSFRAGTGCKRVMCAGWGYINCNMACISYHARETAHPKTKNTRDDTHNQWFAELKSPRLGSAWRSGSGTYKL